MLGMYTWNFQPSAKQVPARLKGNGAWMVWYGMVDACDGYLAAEASGSSFG